VSQTDIILGVFLSARRVPDKAEGDGDEDADKAGKKDKKSAKLPSHSLLRSLTVAAEWARATRESALEFAWQVYDCIPLRLVRLLLVLLAYRPVLRCARPPDPRRARGTGTRGCCTGTRTRPPPPLPRTKWTRRVPHPVLIGHAASLTPY